MRKVNINVLIADLPENRFTHLQKKKNAKVLRNGQKFTKEIPIKPQIKSRDFMG
tara:strand:- start:212736 stop:212897 length:162 start_codon:yes stop_codon:yes gene_type:complete